MILSNFKERLSELIFDAGLTIPTLAEAMGCNRSTLNRFMKGSRTPSVEFLIKLGDFFHCSVDYLIGLEDETYTTSFLTPPPFSKRILELCEIFHATRYAIQHKTQISMASIYTWEKSPRYPAIESLVRLAEFFDCSVDFVIGRSDMQ